ncbi:MAG: hypothetical protein GY856_15885 [bacterium]|nr:hypothetical protein [bacterium]
MRPHLLDTTRYFDGQAFCAKSYEPFRTRKTQVINGVRHHGMGYWHYFSSSADVTALDRNYTPASGQVWCEGSFYLPWENYTGWNNHVACAQDPTQGDDGP